MIILDFFKENIHGSIVKIELYSYSTGYLLSVTNPDNTCIKDFIVKSITYYDLTLYGVE